MALSLRQKGILKILVEAQNPIRIYEIAERMGVSQRTIRYDLEEIDYSLKNLEDSLIRKPRIGVYLETESSFEQLIEKCCVEDIITPYLNKSQRYVYLGLYLLTTEEYSSSEKLAAVLGVSRSAILNDIKEITRICEENYGVKVIAKKGYGYRLSGSEEALRKWLSELLYRALLIKRDGEKFHCLSDGIADLVKSYDVQLIREVIKNSRKIDSFWLPYEEYLKIIAIIKTILYRVKIGKYVKYSENESEKFKKLRTYPIAKEIANKLTHKNFPICEIGGLARELLAGNMKFSDSSSNIFDPKLVDVVDKMMNFLKKVEKWSDASTESLKKDLLSHFDLTLEKVQLNIPNNNQLLDDIKITYIDEFTLADEMMEIFKDEYSVKLTDDEVGYVTMYLVKNREKKDQNEKKNIIVVCGSGKGASRLLAKRIINNIPNIKIKGIMAAFEIEGKDINFDNIDLIISTVDLKKVRLPWLRVNPLISDSEIRKISEKLFERNVKQKKEQIPVSYTDVESIDKTEFAHLIGMILMEVGTTVDTLEREGLIKKEIMVRLGLTLHIVMAVPRWIDRDFNIEPDLDVVKKTHSKIFNSIEKIFKIILEKYNLRVSQTEIVAIMRYLI